MKFAFMAGLPRSGSTLLSSLLNQRDDVYSSPLSYSPEIFDMINHNIFNLDRYQTGYTGPADNLFKNLLPSMYSYKNVNLIIDKSRLWGTPHYLNILKNVIDYDIKIVCPIRPLKDIVASFINLAQKNENNFIDRDMIIENFSSLHTKDINDARVDWLLKERGHLSVSMISLYSAFKEENSNIFHLINYDDLCDETKNCLIDLENFLEIPHFEYNLNNISSEKNLDEVIYGIQSMHQAYPQITKSKINSHEILSEYAIKRCELEDFWTGKLCI